MARQRVSILGVGVDAVTRAEAVAEIAGMVEQERGAMVVTANPEIVWRARHDPIYRTVIDHADLVVADGVGVMMAARMAGRPLPERVPGYDLMLDLLQEAGKRGWRVYLLGGKPGVAEEAARQAVLRWPGLQVAGTHHGYFWNDVDEWRALERALEKTDPNLVFVGMGAPRQEMWMARRLGRGVMEKVVAPRHNPAGPGYRAVMLGVGGSLDVLAGTAALAPAWMRQHGLEWAFRLRDPRRWRRGLVLPAFLLTAAVWAAGIRFRGDDGAGRHEKTGEGT